jgi:Holliday junction resolvasome RuvABC endonuclease subunit
LKIKEFGTGYSSVNGEELYVGIDQSYSGFAITILDENGGYETTVARFDTRGVERLQEIHDHVTSTIYAAADNGNVVATAMEGYAFGSQMANTLGELGGVVKLAIYNTYRLNGDARYPLIVPPTSLKKYVTGKGQGVSKSEIMLQVYKKWGAEFSDDNAADSFAIAKIVSGSHSLQYEKDVYDKLHAIPKEI